MTFIQVRTNECEEALAKLIRDAYQAAYNQTLPEVGFGKVIVWNGRMFQQLRLPAGMDPDYRSYEDGMLRCWTADRTRIQLGSMLGEVFTSPPEEGQELAAHVHEGGRCGERYVVRPFQYYDYHGEA